MHVLELGRILFRLVVRHVFKLFVTERNAETVAEFLQRFVFHTLYLVRLIGRFAIATAHAVTFNGMGQDDGGLAVRGINRFMIGRVYFERIVTAAVELPNIFIGKLFNHLFGFRVLAEEVFASIRAAVGLVVLILAVDRFVHTF